MILFQFQPTKHKSKKKADFDTDFQFGVSVQEFSKDTWNDLTKYIKRKAKQKTDDKIKKIRNLNEQVVIDENINQEADTEFSISDDELKHDKIKLKEKNKKAKKDKNKPHIDFQEVELINDSNTSFYQMNLSRPLLKAIAELQFVHPTPIQAETIPIALLGNSINISNMLYSY